MPFLQVARLMGLGLHHVRKLEQRALAFLRTLNLQLIKPVQNAAAYL